MTRLMSWPDREHYSYPLQSLVVSLFLIFVSTLSFWTGGMLSHQNSLTHRFPRFPPRNLCSVIMLAVFSLIYAANEHSLLLSSYLSRIGKMRILPAMTVWTLVPGHLSSHSALSSYRLCAAHPLATLCLSTTFGPGPGELPSFLGSMVFHHVPIPWKGSGDNNNNGKEIYVQNDTQL